MLDESAEFGIGSCEFAAGECAVVARRAGIVAQMGHDLTVSHFDAIASEEERLASRREFGLDWFAFTSAIPMRQGRCSGDSGKRRAGARDVVQWFSGRVR